MAGTCIADLQGFPIQVTGFSSLTDSLKETSIIPNDISLQFSPSKLNLSFNINSGLFDISSISGVSSFFMGGTQYNVRAIRLCKAGQSGLTIGSGAPIAEYQIWGTPSLAVEQNTIAVLTIPIFLKDKTTPEGLNIYNLRSGNSTPDANRPKLIDTIPKDAKAIIARYATCIETNSTQIPTITIQVAYWCTGVAITSTLRDTQGRFLNLRDNGVPKMGSYKLLSSYTLTANNTKGSRAFNTTPTSQDICITYTKSIPSAGSIFLNGFRFIIDAPSLVSKPRSTPLNNLSSYKCTAISRTRDIQDGRLLVDPATGEPMEDVVKQQEEEVATEEASIPPGRIFEIVAIVIGVLVGLTILAAIFVYIIYPWLLSKKSMEVSVTNSVIGTV